MTRLQIHIVRTEYHFLRNPVIAQRTTQRTKTKNARQQRQAQVAKSYDAKQQLRYTLHHQHLEFESIEKSSHDSIRLDTNHLPDKFLKQESLRQTSGIMKHFAAKISKIKA